MKKYAFMAILALLSFSLFACFENGENGINGFNGFNGYNGADGSSGEDGKDGTDGQNGSDGKDGEDGKGCALEDRDTEVVITCGDSTAVIPKPSVSSSSSDFSSSSSWNSSSSFCNNSYGWLWFDTEGCSHNKTRVCTPAVDCTIITPTTGVDDGGIWYDYDDENDGGNSETVYPVEANEYGDYVAPMIDATGSISLTMILRGAAENPFVGYGFNIVNKAKDTYAVANLGSGVCAEIQNDALFNLEMEMPGNGAQTEYNEPIVAIPAGPRRIINFTWDQFKQQSGWGIIMINFSQAVAFKFKLANGTNGMADQTSTLRIWKFGTLGSCTLSH